ncbi:MAG: hypothetical protein AAB483_03805 [Patescibacteria group bacterium]
MNKFLVLLALLGGQSSPILQDLAKRILDPIRANANYPVPSVAIYQGQSCCREECQELREEFRAYLTKRLPGLTDRKTLRWQWHVGQGTHYFYLLVLDLNTLRVWQTRIEINSDHENTLFKKAVVLMETSGEIVPSGFKVFQLHPAPD